MRPLPDSHEGNAFTYGNGGLNPALRPTSGRLRSRESVTHASAGGKHSTGPLPAQLSGRPEGEGEVYSSGEEREADEYTSSPEPYLSDMDDAADPGAEEGMTRRIRVRRGSEGYEIAPMRQWDAELGTDD